MKRAKLLTGAGLTFALALTGCSGGVQQDPAAQETNAGSTASAVMSAPQRSTPPKDLSQEQMDTVIAALKSQLSKYSGLIIPPSMASPAATAVPQGLAAVQGFVVTPEHCQDAMTNFGKAPPASGATAVGTLALSDSSPGESASGRSAGYLLQILVFPDQAQADAIVVSGDKQISDCSEFDMTMDSSNQLLSVQAEGSGKLSELNIESDADDTVSWEGIISMMMTIETKPYGTASPTATPSSTPVETQTVSSMARSGNVAFVVHGVKSEEPQRSPSEHAVQEILNAAVKAVFP